MASLMTHFHYHGVVQDAEGNAVSGAMITVIDAPTLAVITIYSDMGTTSISNPMPADSVGRFDFWCASDQAISITVAGAGVTSYTLDYIEGDTIYAHEQRGRHAAGTIGLEQLDFTFTDNDVTVHSNLNCNTHGVPSGSGFAYSEATGCTATNAPTFTTLTVTTDTAFTVTEGYTTVDDAVTDDLATKVTAASAGDTLLLKAGTHTISAATVALNKKLTIKGFGRATIAGSSASAPLLTISADDVVLEGLDITGEAGVAHACVEIVGGDNILLSNVHVSGSGDEGIHLNESGTIGKVSLNEVEVSGCQKEGLEVATSSGSVHATNCKFDENDVANTPLYDVSIVKGAAEAAGGHTFNNCEFKNSDRQVYVDAKNVRFHGCFFNGSGGVSLEATANATNCFAPTGLNVIEGSITDSSSVVIGFSPAADYTSSIIELDNTSGAKADGAFFKQEFNHALATRDFRDATIIIGNSALLDDEVWVIKPGMSNEASSDAYGGMAASFILHFYDANNAALVMQAARSHSGGSLTASYQYLFNTVDSQNIVAGPANDVNDYDFADAGGVGLKKIWIRVALWKT